MKVKDLMVKLGSLGPEVADFPQDEMAEPSPVFSQTPMRMRSDIKS